MDIVLFDLKDLKENNRKDLLQVKSKSDLIKDGSALKLFDSDRKDANFQICKNPTREQITRNIDLVYSFEGEKRSDFMHHRNSGLNHVLCKILSERKIIVGFDYSLIFENPSKAHIYLGRMRLNVKMCRKYNVDMVVISLAQTKNSLKSQESLDSFAKVIGMSACEIKKSHEIINERLKYNSLKKQGLVDDGIEVVQ